MHLSHLDSFFWLSGLLGHLALLFVLLFRGRWQRFPRFTALIAANVIKTITLYLIYPHNPLKPYSYGYFYTYWGFAVLDVLLQAAVVYELASSVFRPLGAWAFDLRRHLIWLIIVSLCIAIALTWLSVPKAHTWNETLVMRGSLFSAALLAELFVGMTALSVTAGLPWKTHAARIAQGLGVYSVFCIVVEAGNSYFGLVNGTTVSMILTRARMALYLLCLIYWIITLYLQEPQPESLPGGIESRLLQLRGQTAASLHVLRGRRKP
jgi:hypothetical protein